MVMTRIQVGLVVFADVEVLDFCGPFEVLSVTRLDESRRGDDPSPFEITLIAESSEPIATVGGMRILPDVTFASVPDLDVLIVPGGWGTRREVNNPAMVDFIRRVGSRVPSLLSVCTGSFLLAEAGLLADRRATTHWKSLQRMQRAYPNICVVWNEHVTQSSQDEPQLIWTSAGISAGIELTLRFVAHQLGETVARATAAQMEYPYPSDNVRRIDAETIRQFPS